jgi:photosystem II stability/assembly factor-like uncharacterized protein
MRLPYWSAGVALLMCVLMLTLPSWVRNHSAETAEEEREEAAATNSSEQAPRWFDQLRVMKHNPNHPQPHSLRSQWAAYDAAHKTNSANLLNVVERGPFGVGGRTRAVVVDAQDDEHFVAAGVSGGVWHSIDAGNSWAPVTDQSITLSVSDLTQNPLQPNVWYYSTGEPAGNSADIPGDGIFKSTDNGYTWAQLPSTVGTVFDNVWRIAHSKTTLNTVYVGTGTDGLHRSTDGGITFQRVLRPNAGNVVTDVECLPSGVILAAIRDRGIWRSTSGDSGTFVKITAGLPGSGTSVRNIRIAYCADQPSAIVASFEDGVGSSYDSDFHGVYRSFDAGLTWALLPTIPEDFDIQTRFPWYAHLLAVKPDDPNVILLGSVETAYTNDGGTTWETANTGHADNHVAVFLPNDPERAIVGNDGGLYRLNLGGSSPVLEASLNNGYNVTQYYAGTYFPDGLSAYGGTQDNGTNFFKMGNNNYSEIFGGDGSYCQVNQQNPQFGYVSYQNGMIFRTSNAQATFPNFTYTANDLDADDNFEIDDPTWFINPFEMNQEDGSQLFFPTQERVWRTNNNGGAWVPVTNTGLISDPYCIGISVEQNPVVYVGGQGPMLLRIDDARFATAGQEVDLSAQVPAVLAGSFISNIQVHPTDPGTLYFACSDVSPAPRVWRMYFANTESPIFNDLSGDLPPNLPVNWITTDPANPEQYLVAGTDYGIYTTTNGGENWVKETAFPNVPVFQCKVRPLDRKLFVWTHGRGLWVGDLLPALGIRNATQTTTLGLTVLGNPATNHQVRFGLSTVPTAGQVQVRNTRGQVVAVQLLGTTPQQTVFLPGVANGVYFLEVHTAGLVSRQRFVLQ